MIYVARGNNIRNCLNAVRKKYGLRVRDSRIYTKHHRTDRVWRIKLENGDVVECTIKSNYRVEVTDVTNTRFQEIYERGAWGKNVGSGRGSDPTYCAPYLEYVRKLIDSGKYSSVLDVGCGDWQHSKLIDWRGLTYLGVDMVDAIFYKEEVPKNVLFSSADVLKKGTLPLLFGMRNWDLVLVKDVMQHWSDDEIQIFLDEFVSLPWKTVVVVNDWRFVRVRSKNLEPRDINNPYSWAALPCTHKVLAPLKLRVVSYYGRRRKQMSRADK